MSNSEYAVQLIFGFFGLVVCLGLFTFCIVLVGEYLGKRQREQDRAVKLYKMLGLKEALLNLDNFVREHPEMKGRERSILQSTLNDWEVDTQPLKDE